MSKLAKTGKNVGKAMTPFDLFNRSLDHFFNDFHDINLPRGFMNDWTPSVHVKEYKNHFKISTDLPGLKKEDIKIKLDDHMLTVEGERNEEIDDDHDVRHHREERRYGKFYRSFQLPDYIDEDSMKAKFRNGVLDITINKLSQEERRKEPKWIDIEEADTQHIGAGSEQKGRIQSGDHNNKGRSDRDHDKSDKKAPNVSDVDPQKAEQREPSSPENAPQKVSESHKKSEFQKDVHTKSRNNKDRDLTEDGNRAGGDVLGRRQYHTQETEKIGKFDPLKVPKQMPNPVNDRERKSPNDPVSKDPQNPVNTIEQHTMKNPKDAPDSVPSKDDLTSRPGRKDPSTPK